MSPQSNPGWYYNNLTSVADCYKPTCLALKVFCKWSSLDLTMDVRCMSFSLQIQETTSDDEILIDICHHGTWDRNGQVRDNC